jgi:hypothetical protein
MTTEAIGHAVNVHHLDAATATVTVDGMLDVSTVGDVCDAIEAAQIGPVQRLVVDLSHVTAFTDEAPAALHRCCRPMSSLPKGLAMQAQSRLGREALLATLLADPDDGERLDETMA